MSVRNLLSNDHLHLVAYHTELALLKRTLSGARPLRSLIAFAIAKNPQSSPLYWRDGVGHSKPHSPIDNPIVISRSWASCRRTERANNLRATFGIESMNVTRPACRSIENIAQWSGKCKTETTLVMSARAEWSSEGKAVDNSFRRSLEL